MYEILRFNEQTDQVSLLQWAALSDLAVKDKVCASPYTMTATTAAPPSSLETSDGANEGGSPDNLLSCGTGCGGAQCASDGDME